MLKRIVLASVLALMSTTSFAAEVGRADFNGREIILNDDNTWSYAETVAQTPKVPLNPKTQAKPTTAECLPDDLARSGVVPLSVCIKHEDWDAGEATGAQEFVFYSKDQKMGFAIVSEQIVISPQQFRDAIVQVAATGAKVDKSQVRVFNERQPTVGGQVWNSMHYQVTMQGTPLEYQNYRLSKPGFGAVQMVFWSLPTDAAHTASVVEEIMSTVTVGR